MTASTYTPQTHQGDYNTNQSNLKVICHLHSNSDSPEVIALKRFLATAIKEGYNNLTVTGQEPFNYTELKELLKYTMETGYHNSVITNGNFLNNEQNQEALRHINLVLVSLDGNKEEHNRIWNNDFAFDQMQWALEILKENQARFGFLHKLHSEPIETLKWICNFAMVHKAQQVQLCSNKNLNNRVADQSDELRLKFFVLYHFYKLKYQDDFDLNLDLLHRNIVMQYPQLAFQFVCEDICDSNFYREIVIDEEGYVLPVAHGFTRTLALGNIYENISLTEMMNRFHTDKLRQLKNIYLKVYQNIVDNPDHLLFNYPEMVLNESLRMEEFGYAHPDNALLDNFGVC